MTTKSVQWLALSFLIAIATTAGAQGAKSGSKETRTEPAEVSDYRRARLLYEAHRYREAAPIYREIAENHPTSDVAIHAANQLLDCLFMLKDYKELAEQADRFLAMPDLLRDAELKKLLEKIKRQPPSAASAAH